MNSLPVYILGLVVGCVISIILRRMYILKLRRELNPNHGTLFIYTDEEGFSMYRVEANSTFLNAKDTVTFNIERVNISAMEEDDNE